MYDICIAVVRACRIAIKSRGGSGCTTYGTYIEVRTYSIAYPKIKN